MKLGLTNHAVDRYVERVAPALDPDKAREQLEVLIRMAGEPNGKPNWLYLPEFAPEAAEHYLELSDGIAVAIKGGFITTVITRGGGSPKHQAKKAERRKQRRAKRRQRPIKDLRGRREEPKERWR